MRSCSKKTLLIPRQSDVLVILSFNTRHVKKPKACAQAKTSPEELKKKIECHMGMSRVVFRLKRCIIEVNQLVFKRMRR